MSEELSTPVSFDAKPRHDPKAFILMLSLAIMALTAVAVIATQLGWSNL
jgi:hypothetical protein